MKRTSGWLVVVLAIVSLPLRAQDWTKESKDRTRRTALHGSTQLVRGDSGKWNDDALVQHAPPLEQKPAKLALDVYLESNPDPEVRIRLKRLARVLCGIAMPLRPVLARFPSRDIQGFFRVADILQPLLLKP